MNNPEGPFQNHFGFFHLTHFSLARTKNSSSSETGTMAEINRLLPFYQDLDFETADLILQLQLEDVEHVRDRAKGKQREGTEPDDSQQALAMMESDLQSMRSLIADRHMSRSIAAAVLADRPAIEESIREEEIAHRDRIMAQRLNGSDFTDTTQDQPESGEIKDSLLSKLAGMYMCEDDETLSVIAGLSNEVSDIEDGTSRAESSTQASSRRSESREIKCEACHDRKEHFEVMTNACGHAYCKTCLQELFELSTRDESLFPPRCCKQPMDIDDVQIFLTKELKDQFQKAKVEFGTKNRTYCSRGACSAFIPSASIEGDLATCQVCLTMTCAICKEGAHGGDCPEDTTLQEVLAAATENGWQRCYSCRRIIEIDYGCNHMT